VGLDLVPAMLARARPRCAGRNIVLVEGDSQCLPFSRDAFDAVIAHLIVAVVPDPLRALREIARVTCPGGFVLVFDKFLRRGRLSIVRRLLSPFAARIATRLDVVFEDLLAQVPDLIVTADVPLLAGGWFRAITLQKRAPPTV
jgi:ubiquinone/menaquinone biosynthesis C-methylase UbiE